MNSNRIVGIVMLSLAATLGGCAADPSPSSAPNPPAAQEAEGIVIEASDATRTATKIAYYTVDAAGHGKAFAIDGAVLATFDTAKEEKGYALHLTANGASADIHYTITTSASGVTVDGTADAVPFSASFDASGRPLEGAQRAVLDPSLDRVLRAFRGDLETYSQAHTKKGCLLAGLGVVVSVLTLEPWGIGLGFIGVVAECGD
jgi:hypothetical protein